jgi:pyruvate,water dikinase
MVINANFGLGESVVSGEGEVDQWILDKATRAVLSASIGSKARQVLRRGRAKCILPVRTRPNPA